jgi:hypothetical protein
MDRTSVILGVIIGLLVVVVPMGASTAFDRLIAPGTPEVTVERINSTHAAVAWTTERPTQGYLRTRVSRECGRGWGKTIKTINDSSFTRTHLVIASIYDLNTSQVALASVPGNGSLAQYSVVVFVMRDASGAGKVIMTRNLSQTCR